ncbi:MAG: hypothetical protein EA420_17845 [Candidatus Competibacteraceae bacterium]|nr:MAG: hypothetical protein EA420_17845 [Candidatus Competibacteraceae bacterium]
MAEAISHLFPVRVRDRIRDGPLHRHDGEPPGAAARSDGSDGAGGRPFVGAAEGCFGLDGRRGICHFSKSTSADRQSGFQQGVLGLTALRHTSFQSCSALCDRLVMMMPSIAVDLDHLQRAEVGFEGG